MMAKFRLSDLKKAERQKLEYQTMVANGFGRTAPDYRALKNLETSGSNQDIPQMNPIQQFSLMQLDLTCRF
jgi:hypothetical protein